MLAPNLSVVSAICSSVAKTDEQLSHAFVYLFESAGESKLFIEDLTQLEIQSLGGIAYLSLIRSFLLQSNERFYV